MSAVAILSGVGIRSRRRGGLIATFGVLVLAAIGITAGLAVSRQGAPLLDDVAEDAAVAHLVLRGQAAAIEGVAADPEVVAWSGPFTTVGGVELILEEDPVPMQLTVLESPDIEVNRPAVRSGKWASAADEIVLDRSIGADLGIKIGDTILLRASGSDSRFEVVGTAVSMTDCFYPQCEPGRAWIAPAALDTFRGSNDIFSQGWFRFDDAAQADPFVERQAASGVEGIGGSESWLDTREDFLTLDRLFGSFVTAFGVFVLAVAAVVIAGSTAMRILAQRRQIGLLGAIGCTPRQITFGLLLENLAIGVAAGVLGWFLGGFLTPSLQIGIGRTLGAQDPSWSLFGLVVCVVTISLILMVATVVPAVSAARRPVTDVLRDAPKERTSWFNRRATRLPGRLSLLGLHEAASRPTRAALAALAIAVAVVGTLVSIGVIGGIDAVAADPAVAGTPWDIAVIPGDVAVADVETALGENAGVASWYSEVARRSTLDKGAFLSVATGGDPGAARFDIAEGRPLRAAPEAIAGYGFLERFGFDIGDEIEVLAGTTPVTVEIVGQYRVTEDSGEILRYRLESLTTMDAGAVPDIYRIVTSDGFAPADVGAQLVERLGPQARIEILDTGVHDLSPMLMVLRLVALVLLLMAGTNLLSTLLTSTREAAGRIGVQLAMGFTPRQIVTQGAVAGAFVGVIATVVGVPLGLWIFRVLSDAVSRSIGVGPGWVPWPSVAAIAILAVGAIVAAGGLGALAAARTASRPAADLVRGE